MKLNTILIINAIVSLLNATGAILFPSIILNTYGVPTGTGAELMAQYAGIGSVAIGLLAYWATRIKQAEAKRYILMAFFVSDIIGVILSILGTFNKTMNISGWALVAIYLFFATGYGYFLFVKKEGM